MLMDNNDIKEGEESDNVSIHSIVSDQVEFDSDNESPSDQVGQVDKIIMNHVIKTIIDPGRGVDKPSKFDFVEIKYSAYIKNVTNNLPEKKDILINDSIQKDYLYNIILPYGIVKAIKFMRKGEKARIILEPKYGFRKVQFEKVGRYLDQKNCTCDINNELFEKLVKSTLIYEIELINFEKMYDLTGKRNLMKRIIQTPTKNKLNRPCEDSEVKINVILRNNDSIIFEEKEIETILNDSNFTIAEKTIIKSMKKGEKCLVDITLEYFIDCYNKNKNSIISKKISNFINPLNQKENNIRIIYEIELLKFKNNTYYYTHNEVDYTQTVIVKGIGNVSPWKDALIMLMSHLEIENEKKEKKIIYSDLPSGMGLAQFIQKIKGIKSTIKEIPLYETQVQFIVDSELKKENISYPIYDPFEKNFPSVFRKEILQSMKPLSVINLSFTLNKENYEDNLFIFEKNKKYPFDSEIDFTTSPSYRISYTCCLLNLEENVFVLNNKLIENKIEKLSYYKSIANDFYTKGFIHKAKKLNKKLSDEYIKYINEPQGVTVSMESQEIKELIDIKKSKFYRKDIDEVMKKIMSNLIVILYKMGRKEQCETYINQFLRYYLKDEKIMYYQYKILNEKGFYDKAKNTLDTLIKYLEEVKKLSNIDIYKRDLDFVEKKIKEHEKNHVNYMKKMVKVLNKN